MELRRRPRRRRKQVYLTNYGRALATILVSCAMILFFAFSKGGLWLSEEVFKPLFKGKESASSINSEQQKQQDQGQEQAGEAFGTQPVELPALSCYALQMGVYSDYENAFKSAEELRLRGAAGYIIADGDKYRVLAAAYESEEELRSVRAQLENGGIASAAYSMQAESRRVTIQGTADMIEKYRSGFAFLPSLNRKLYDLAIAFDRDSVALERGREELGLIEDETKQYFETFSSVSDQSSLQDQKIIAIFESLIHEMDDVLAGPADTRASFTASLKWLRLMLCDKLMALSKSIG